MWPEIHYDLKEGEVRVCRNDSDLMSGFMTVAWLNVSELHEGYDEFKGLKFSSWWFCQTLYWKEIGQNLVSTSKFML